MMYNVVDKYLTKFDFYMMMYRLLITVGYKFIIFVS